MEFVEELPGLVERVEGGVGPAPEEEERVLVDHEAGAGLRARVGPHGQGPAETRDSKKEKKLTIMSNHLYVSRSGSFHQQAKKLRKP
jgi:hypothetical protein